MNSWGVEWTLENGAFGKTLASHGQPRPQGLLGFENGEAPGDEVVK